MWAIIVLAAFCAYLVLFLPSFPVGGAGWGGDYSQHLPNLLAGHYWFLKNGPLAVPWFNPGQCGGLPYLGDLNVAYYSLPQWATFAIGPIGAVRLTFLAFAALGASGFFLLMRARFGSSDAAAASAAVLFLFSGFFAARMIAGHLTFHPFNLTPWIAWAALAGADRSGTPGQRRLWPAICIGVALAYMFHAGMVHAIAPVILAVGAIVAVHGQMSGHRRAPWIALGAGILISLALSAQRLAAAAAFIEQFPRSEYTLPGFRDPLQALYIAFWSVFWRPPAHALDLLTNVQWALDLHEWAYGVGPAALFVLIAGIWTAATRRRSEGASLSGAVRPMWVWLAVGFVLLLPAVLNWYYAPWTAFLKTLPVLGSSSNLLRWFALYTVLATFFTALALDRVTLRRGRRSALGAAIILSTILWNIWSDFSPRPAFSYDAAPMQRAWHAATTPAAVPAVTHIAVMLDADGKPAAPLERSDAIGAGYSQLLCYQPMFGYRLERMPIGALRPGPALDELEGGILNVKNPACYTYPVSNQCRPGDHFFVRQRPYAERFLRYEPYSFGMPAVQRVANGVTLGALVLVVLVAARAVVTRTGMLIAAQRRSAAGEDSRST